MHVPRIVDNQFTTPEFRNRPSDGVGLMSIKAAVIQGEYDLPKYGLPPAAVGGFHSAGDINDQVIRNLLPFLGHPHPSKNRIEELLYCELAGTSENEMNGRQMSRIPETQQWDSARTVEKGMQVLLGQMKAAMEQQNGNTSPTELALIVPAGARSGRFQCAEK